MTVFQVRNLNLIMEIEASFIIQANLYMTVFQVRNLNLIMEIEASFIIQANLPMLSPLLLSSHLYNKVTFFLSCHRKLHMNLISFKRSPVL